MVIISSVNNTNYSGLSTPGHIVTNGSGLSGVTGLTSDTSNTTIITNINNITSGNSYNNEELDDKFQTIKNCIVASDIKMTNMFSKVKCDFDEINEALVTSDIKTANMFSKVNCNIEEVNESLVKTDLKMVNMFSKISSELDVIRIEINMHYEEGMLPISEEDLNTIYNCFIIPYINCEIYQMGSIKKSIDLNNTLNCLISVTTAPKTKLVLMIFKDILCVLNNARNEHIKLISYKNQLETVRKKYIECHKLVEELRLRIKSLLGEEGEGLGITFQGSLGITMWQPPKFAYIELKFNLDYAWYKFLYNTDKIDLDKYNATIAYVRSFGSRKRAEQELKKLLDEKFKTLEDDLKNN